VTAFLFWLAVLGPAAAVGFGLAHISSDSLRLVLFVIISLAPALLIAFMLWPALHNPPDVVAGAASVAPIAFAWSAAGVIAYLAGRHLDK
jgi:hypothetical protein